MTNPFDDLIKFITNLFGIRKYITDIASYLVEMGGKNPIPPENEINHDRTLLWCKILITSLIIIIILEGFMIYNSVHAVSIYISSYNSLRAKMIKDEEYKKILESEVEKLKLENNNCQKDINKVMIKCVIEK